MRRLRRAVENDRGPEVASGLCARFGPLAADLGERTADLHLHDLQPRRKQPLRLLVGLEHRLQQSGDTLPGLEPQSHQVLELGQIGSQRSDQRLDRRRRLSGRAGAQHVVQADDEAIDLRPHPVRDLVAFLGRGGREQRGGRRDQPVGRTRDRQRADHLRHAGIDQLEPIADLAKCIDAGRRGQDGEAADREECEQQPRTHSDSPPVPPVIARGGRRGCRNVRLFRCQCRHGPQAPSGAPRVRVSLRLVSVAKHLDLHGTHAIVPINWAQVYRATSAFARVAQVILPRIWDGAADFVAGRRAEARPALVCGGRRLCCQIAFRLRDERLVSNAAMFMRLLARTAAATHNSKRSAPSARQRFMPRPRNRTEMRPSMPARKR